MNVGPAPTPSHPLIPSAARALLEVRVVRDAPRIAFVWPEQPEPHEVYAAEHALTAMVWSRSAKRGWDVRPVHGWDRNRMFAGAELVLDRDTYGAMREGEKALEELRTVLSGGQE